MAGRTVQADNEYFSAALEIDPNITRYPTRDGWMLMGDMAWGVGSSEKRGKLVQKYAWAIPNAEAITALAQLGRLVEIGAGTGYWASLIARAGGDVVAYDEKPGKNTWCDVDQLYHPVAVGGPERVADHTDRALFLCWPPMSPMAASALAAYRGETVAYVGESEGGCTADYTFFVGLDENWVQKKQIDIPQWCGIHDYLSIWRRKVRRSR